MKFHWKKLYTYLSRYKNSDVSWREIARVGKFSPSLITRISQGKAISVVNLFKVLCACDAMLIDLRQFVKVKQ